MIRRNRVPKGWTVIPAGTDLPCAGCNDEAKIAKRLGHPGRPVERATLRLTDTDVVYCPPCHTAYGAGSAFPTRKEN